MVDRGEKSGKCKRVGCMVGKGRPQRNGFSYANPSLPCTPWVVAMKHAWETIQSTESGSKSHCESLVSFVGLG